MKKLLIATDSFLPRWDGVARFLKELLPYVEEEYKVTVVAPDFKGEYIKDEKIEVVRINLSRFSIGDYNFPKIDKKKIKDLVEENDIIFSQTIGPIGMSAVHYAHKLHKVNLFYTHSIDWELIAKSISHNQFFEYIIYHIVRLVIRSLYNKCDIILTPSEEVAQILQFEDVKTPKVIVNMGVNTDVFKPAEDKAKAKKRIGIDPEKKVIGFTGRLAKEKDIETLFKAFKRLEKKKDCVLLIVGGGKKNIKEMLDNKENIIVTGPVNNVVNYLQAMDIYVLPSLTETSSLSTMEAMACELGVISTKVGQAKYYIKEKENGLFFPKKNHLVLSMKMDWLFSNDSVRQAFGVKARNTIVQDFSWSNTVDKIKTLLGRF